MNNQNYIGYKYRNDTIKNRFKHYNLISYIEEVFSRRFGKKPEIEIISINKVFKVNIDDKSYKINFKFPENNFHEVLLDNNIRVPKIIFRESIGFENLDMICLEWIEGFTYPQLNDKTIFKDIPKEYFKSLGELLGKLNNIKHLNFFIAMSDIYWTNFLISNEEVYLVDTTKVYLTLFPEYFVITQFLLHTHTPIESRVAFLDEYLKYRDFNFNEENIIMKQLFKGLYEKLD